MSDALSEIVPLRQRLTVCQAPLLSLSVPDDIVVKFAEWTRGEPGFDISQNVVSAESLEDADFNTDEDPFDDISDDAPGIGIVVRTDYADEDAWQAFMAKLQDAEAEFAAESTADDDSDGDADGDAEMADADADPNEAPSTSTPSAAQGAAPSPPPTDAAGDSAMGDSEALDNENDNDNDDDDAGNAAGPESKPASSSSRAPVFSVVNPPPDDPRRATFAGLSNLGVLRLLNDVDARRAPVPPRGTRRLRPPHRLVDCDGWQEAYRGRPLWVYDARSNADACVRVVGQQGAALYGTATGDSWRARVSHICELQVGLAAGAMSIDFGGLDRWDYAERARNLEEAARLSL